VRLIIVRLEMMCGGASGHQGRGTVLLDRDGQITVTLFDMVTGDLLPAAALISTR
jgi:hypothetical protein